MNKYKFFGLVYLPLSLSLLLSLSGCTVLTIVPGSDYILGEDGVFRDREGDYLIAATIPRTEIPNDLDGYIIDDLLIIPELNSSVVTSFLQIPRPKSTKGPNDRGVVIQRMNEQSWIIVDASPSQVWPKIRDYWRSNGINMSVENPSQGIMETGWFVMTGNILTREKFKVIVEPGFQDSSSEIKLLHLTMAQSTPVFDQVTWPESSSDPELESDMLNNLSIYLVDAANLYAASTVSFLAGSISSEGKAEVFRTPGGLEVLRLEASYQRSWAAIGRALQRAEVEVIAQNVDSGIYEVDYIIRNEEDEPGFFKKVITINGVFSNNVDNDYHSLRIQLLESAGGVDVIIESLDPIQAQQNSVREAASSLLQIIRDFIA